MAVVGDYINKLLGREDLTFGEATELLDMVFGGTVEEVKIAAILTALRMKGPKAAELAGFARSLRNHAVKVETGLPVVVDTCGTGGSKVKTFNISTAAALVAAGAGAYVAKHGNRAITSNCGSADVLSTLGVKIDCGAQKVAACIREAHIGFMFAPMFHPAMKYVQPIRKNLGFMTVFNMLGPLANPAAAPAQVMGVPEAGMMPMIVEALKLLGVRRAMVVHSEGLDEIHTAAVTKVLELKDGAITASEIDPATLGFKTPNPNELAGSDAATNTGYVLAILEGRDRGARRDIVVLNAAAAIIVAGLAENFKSAIAKAAESIDNGRAAECLKMMVSVSNG